MGIRTASIAALLSATVTLGYAQQQGQQPDHEAHHPDAASQANPQTPAPPQAAVQTPSGQGPGMPDKGDMIGSGSMMSRMANGMPMMGMMQMMGNTGAGMGGMATIDRVEGRIAFLKTEMKITNEQSDAWNRFAESLRANAKKLGELRAMVAPQDSASQPMTLTARLEWQEKWLKARGENTRAIRSAYTELSAKLTDDQKKTADEILAPHVGMMTMMSGMIGAGQMGMGNSGQMGMGNMNSGKMPPATMQGNQMMRDKMAPR